jgi:hypothetical protein
MEKTKKSTLTVKALVIFGKLPKLPKKSYSFGGNSKIRGFGNCRIAYVGYPKILNVKPKNSHKKFQFEMLRGVTIEKLQH